LVVDKNGVATVHVKNAPVTDQIYFLGPGTTPAIANFDISWTPTGPVRYLTPGSNNPTDPTNFKAAFREAIVRGSFSVKEGSVTYSGSWHGSTGAGVDFAEIGLERNGVFANAHARHR
jgi:hypothetical protein